jgi:selenocysteine-specific translation elongation factor
MKHLTAGFFHDDSLGRELGKKETESDLLMFNRKMGDCVYTFMSPVADKLIAKSQIVSVIDAALVLFDEMTRELGETVLLLDSLKVSKGIMMRSPSVTLEQINTIIQDTSLSSFIELEEDPIKILQSLKSVNPERDVNSPVEVVIDHSFSVKGVGEVLLGFVKKGVVRKYDKLRLLPADKEVIVRSIQLQDEDHEEASAGSRVGLAVKGATVDEMKRGSIVTASSNVRTSKSLKLSFEKNQFYPEDLKIGPYHVTVGMQTIPITITMVGFDSIAIESEKPMAYAPEDKLLLLDLNAKKARVVGCGNVIFDSH